VKTVCVGGGPAGLYLSILMKLADRDHQVSVLERNPAGVTYGWGVVFWDDLLDALYGSDPVTAREIAVNSVPWNGQEVRVNGGRKVYLGGSGFSIGRKRLLDILVTRALDLGVDVRFDCQVEQPSHFADADLIVACDGANSRLRQRYVEHFRTSIDVGRNKYIWLGTHKVFDAFTFAFEETSAGWIWFHAYYFNDEASTCIVECAPETWQGLAFDRMSSEESMRQLERIFESYLDGHTLICQTRGLDNARWLNFKRITNQAWCWENVVLVGDAAHTTHFAIGSGTKLAVLDAIGLATSLREHERLDLALKAYEAQRQGELVALQRSADSSTTWFEDIPKHIDQRAVLFAFSLWKRRGHEPFWRFPLHLATQVAPLRTLRRLFTAARRSIRARRRGRLVRRPAGALDRPVRSQST
jgi:anthraniloyl-CoA monooxygenase